MRNARAMPARSSRSIICSSERPAISGCCAFILSTKKPSRQAGRWLSASGVQMFTTASTARIGLLTRMFPLSGA